MTSKESKTYNKLSKSIQVFKTFCNKQAGFLKFQPLVQNSTKKYGLIHQKIHKKKKKNDMTIVLKMLPSSTQTPKNNK